MIKDLTLGQFFPANSIIHRFDPRLKIVFFMLILLAVLLFVSNFFSLVFALIFVVFLMLISKVPLSMYLKSLKVILPILIFTMLLNLLYTSDGTILLDFWVIKLTTGGITRSILMSVRVVLLIFVSAILTYTTSPNDLTDAIDRLLSPLKYIGLGRAVHTMSMMMTIALRFIPTLVEETEKIMNAQKARGADFETGKLIDRIKAIIPILIPLLISSIRRAYDLAEAMECRCYNGGEGRQRMKQLHICRDDIFSALFAVVCCTALIVLDFVF